MLGTDSNLTKTEAVAIFHDVQSFQATIDDLLLAGFDHVDINVLAHEDTVTSKLGERRAARAPAGRSSSRLENIFLTPVRRMPSP
jgi:hypothetical protein